MLQTSSNDSQTNSWKYELYFHEDDIEYALEKAYEGCNYISSIEEVSSETGLNPEDIYEILSSPNGSIYCWETIDTSTWEVSRGWN